MPFTNLFQSSTLGKPHDDAHDCPSNTPTPPGSGGATPQPDPSDKRLPGILSSYFGQVRRSLDRPSTSMSTCSTPRASSDLSRSTDGPEAPGASSDSYTASVSPSERDSTTPPVQPQDQVSASLLKNFQKHKIEHSYPTPPSSSSSSMKRSSDHKEDAAETASIQGFMPARTSSPRRKGSSLDKPNSKSRRQTQNPAAPSGIVTTSDVHASHFSLPGLVVSRTNPDSPIHSRHPASDHSASTIQPSEKERLTPDASASQSTPPRTPRTQSTDSKVRTPPVLQTSSTRTSIETSKSSNNGTEHALMGEPKGKLSVSIDAGRGLRPSHNPYVVCEFQQNQYISKGARADSGIGADDDASKENSHGGTPMRRGDSDMGRPMAIPMKSRQSSHTSFSDQPSSKGKEVTDPVWDHEALFDVVGDQTEIDISIYDHSSHETFLGHVRFNPSLNEENLIDKWYLLAARDGHDDRITGEIHLRIKFQSTDKKHYGPEDFKILKLIGKGTFGQVFQVRKKDTQRIYAMKVLSKKVIVQKKEVAHTVGERNILVRTAMTESPFIVGLKFSFQTPTDLYLVTDYMSGGELFWHLQKEGRFQEERAKFYIAELILALQHLHQHDIVYRDLKPENILLDANGHIALCDFGLSKANLTKGETTNTFCGTTEYLAPEVLLDEQGYTKMVDFWSLGVLVFEMCCGWSPFYAEDTQQMYKNIAFGKVRFPRDALSNDGRNFVKGLLNRNPKHRIGAQHDAEELKQHPFFADIDWVALSQKRLVPPFKPRLKSETDTSNFDPEFTNALNGASSLNARAAALASGIDTAATPLSPTMQANFKGFTFVDESSLEKQFQEDDRMEEDDDLSSWEFASRQQSRGDRMSGIQRSTAADDGIFNSDGFDV